MPTLCGIFGKLPYLNCECSILSYPLGKTRHKKTRVTECYPLSKVLGKPVSSKNMQKPTRVYHTHAHLVN